MTIEMINDNWLSNYQSNVFSRNGEDGILEKIFDVLELKKGWCVEFGASDGKKKSNACHLITNRGWSGVLIEGDPLQFEELRQNYSSRADVHCVQKLVGFDSTDSLDAVLKNHPLPFNFDLLSIDIEGNDIHAWESLQNYQPKVVIIEYNPTIPNHVVFIQARDLKVNQGSSLLALVNLGKSKGYQLVATTETNAIFVKDVFYSRFGIQDNSLDKLRKETAHISYLFQLYDGTLVLHGNKKLLWSGVPIREDKLQIVPKCFRYVQTSSGAKKFFRSLWRFLYTRKII